MKGRATRQPRVRLGLVYLSCIPGGSRKKIHACPIRFRTEKPITVASVNAAIKAAAEGPLKGILGYTGEELVSSDFKGNPLSSIFDSLLTKVVGGNTGKVISWYDNEWGYSNRVKDLILFLVKKGL